MYTTIVRYKVRADKVDANKALVRRVFEELDERKPDGLRYVAFNLADGASFVHISVVETEDGEHPLQKCGAFGKFIENIGDRCDKAPEASSAEIVGSYRLFWEKFAGAK